MKRSDDIMKKTVIIILFLVLCGCTANYNVEIKDNRIIENMSIIENDFSKLNKENDIGSTMDKSFDSLTVKSIYDEKNYNITRIKDNTKSGVEYNKEFSMEDFNTETIAKQCFKNFMYVSNEKGFYIDTGKDSNCFQIYEYLDQINVTLKSSYVVKDNNADKIDGNIYIWNINRDNYKDKRIKISFLYNNAVDNIKKEESYSKIVNFILYSLGIVILIVCIIIYEKVRKSNK